MIITYYGDESVKSFDLNKKGIERIVLDSEVEVVSLDNEWFLLSEEGKRRITEDDIYEINKDDKKHLLVTEKFDASKSEFRNYYCSGNSYIKIGRAADNDISINNLRISSHHLTIEFKERGIIEVVDLNSSNGTYVNGKKISRHNAKYGDVIYLLGIKIIIGNKFLSINTEISYNSNKLGINSFNTVNTGEYCKEITKFYPSPRFKREIEKRRFKIDAPPENQIGESMPMIYMIGPSITMGIASLATAMFSVSNALSTGNVKGAIPSMIMSLGMVVGTLVWPVVLKKYEKNRRIKKETLRQEKYKRYLLDIEKDVNGEKELQRDILNENFVDIKECVRRIEKVNIKLWEKNFGQEDFLKVRVGTGAVSLQAEFVYPERKFELIDDNLNNQMLEYCESPKYINNVPITISLFENYITGIIGNSKKAYNLITNIIFQLATYYSYDDLKMVFITSDEKYEFVKWLPHIWDNEKKVRFLINNLSDSKDVVAYLNLIYEEREEMNENEVCETRPYYIIFDLNKEISRKINLLNKIYKTKRNINFSVISVCPEIKDIPKETSNVVELTLEAGRIFNKNDVSGINVKFAQDKEIGSDLELLSKRLSNILLDTSSDYYMPNSISFLQMYGVGKIEHLNILNRWRENNPVESLEVPIGVDSYGEPFKLDLHEKYDGPHGLVAGMTGSGKSEFIMTYILSLAINYHPYEVSFILIDYKGGGMAKTFEKLPHVAGIITNLDGASVKRSLVSIESELKRRQKIFSDTSTRFEISNIDIYKYQNLYREGKVSEPLQHLFIISDEFAELKTQQPEFMEQLISAARIGRSLGVHLILATQKPAGIVDDQIWSNSRFRACLKVQERADSMDMLKRPDAAELSKVGRFYLQVGYNEKFDIGQSAYSGAPYYPMDKYIEKSEDYIEVINSVGRTLKTVKYDRFKEKYSNAGKQIDSITSYINGLAKDENICIRPMWLPPLSERVYITELKTEYNAKEKMNKVLYPIIGEYDDPVNQKKDILRLPLSKEGNVIIYGVAGSGKTTLLITMIYELIEEHTPNELNMYVLDFDSEKLKIFSKAPHIGDIISSFEKEKVNNLFKLLIQEMERRKNVLSNYDGEYNDYIKNHDMAYIVIFVNNYSMFNELYEDNIAWLEYLTREGTKYGIFFILSCNKVNGINSRVAQNFKQHIALQLNSEDDYMMILGKTDGLYPAGVKGRGLIKTDRIYEFQSALITSNENSIKYVKEYCEAYFENWDGDTAKSVPVLPENVNYEFISNKLNKCITAQNFEIPVGVSTQTHEIVKFDFARNYINIITSSENAYLNFVMCFSKILNNNVNEKCLILDSEDNIQGMDNLLVANSEKDICKNVDDLFEEVLYRNNTYKDAEDKKVADEFEYEFIVLVGYSKLYSILSDEGKEKLQLILEKGRKEYKINIVILDCVQNLKTIIYDKWFKSNFSKNDGIYVGSDILNQYVINVVEKNNSQINRIEEPYGYVVNNGKIIKSKMLWENNENE